VSQRGAGSGLGRRGRSRRIGTAKLVIAAVIISAVCMGTLTAKAVISRKSCSDSAIVLNVTASTDITPAIQSMARSFNAQSVSENGHCIQVEVTGADSAAEAAQIDGQATTPGLPAVDVWIPDSSLWVDVARSYPVGAGAIQAVSQSVARSPLLLVTTPKVAAKTHIFDSPPTWSVLLPPSYGGPPASLGLSVDLPDPSDSSSGLASIIEVSRLLGTGPAARTAFTKFEFNSETTANFDSVAGLEVFAASTEPPLDRQAVTVASEQAVLAYDAANPKAPLEARYPTGASASLGTPELNYPYVLTTSKSLVKRAADKFDAYLQTPAARSVIRYYGFRDPGNVPDTMPGAAGLSSQPLQLASTATAAETAANLQVWEKLGLGSRDLTLIDVSPAMASPDGIGTQTIEETLTQAAARGLALFPDSTHMGLWEIGNSTSLSKPYTQLVSIGALPADYGVISRRTQLQQIIATLKPGNGTLALHDALLAAYQEMTRTYAPNYANAVLVLTAGVDTARGDMSLSDLLARLKALYNPAKKVEFVILMFGKTGNFTAMREIADATGGVAYQISNPAQIGQVFIEAIAHRMCDQGCAAP